MSKRRENKMIMYLGDYGHEITFRLRKADGTKFEVEEGVDTVTFEYYKAGESSTTSKATNIDVDDDDPSKVTYEVQDGDFDSAGTWWARFKVNNMNCYPEAMIIVKSETPEGE